MKFLERFLPKMYMGFGDEAGSGDAGDASGNDDTGDAGDGDTGAGTATATAWLEGFSNPDLKNNASLKRYDSPEKLAEAYLNLEKTLGTEKIPWPKDEKDEAGWQRVYDKLGIPKDEKGYEVDDIKMPDALKGMAFDKASFIKIAHEFKLTPAQAKGLWGKYGETILGAHQKALADFTGKVEGARAALMQEWGDKFETNKALAQKVMNMFSGDKDTAEFIASQIGSNPLGMKFFAKIGEHFAEHSVGDFGPSGGGFTKSPAEARAEIEKIQSDPYHPYWGNKDKAGQPIPQALHKKAVEQFEALMQMSMAGQK